METMKIYENRGENRDDNQIQPMATLNRDNDLI